MVLLPLRESDFSEACVFVVVLMVWLSPLNVHQNVLTIPLVNVKKMIQL